MHLKGLSKAVSFERKNDVFEKEILVV